MFNKLGYTAMTLTFLIAVLFTAPVWAETGIERSNGQTVYVPVYSHIAIGDKEKPFYLTVTISIRNTDLSHGLTILAADYYNTEGQLIKAYLKKPITLNALASIQFVVEESDKAGGIGANFIIKWQSEHDINYPIIESVMIGASGQQGISFTSRGQATMDSTD